MTKTDDKTIHVEERGLIKEIRAHVRDVPDFPVPGVLFRDITPLLAEPELMRAVIDVLAAKYRGQGIGAVVAIEARGFLFGLPLALVLDCPFVPVRKPGKLPAATRHIDYSLEYGTAGLEIHDDAIQPGTRVVIVDDLLATGGTSQAAGRLVHQLHGDVAGFAYVIELTELHGREQLDAPVYSLLQL